MAITYDAKTLIAASASNPVTGTHTCGSGAKLLVVSLTYANGTRTGTPTYNGVAMHQVGGTYFECATSPETRIEQWYLTDPDTGSAYTVSVPNPNGLLLEACVSSYAAPSGYSIAYFGYDWTQKVDSSLWLWWATTTACLVVGQVGCGDDTYNPSFNGGVALYTSDCGTWGAAYRYLIQTAAGTYNIQFNTDVGEDHVGLAGYYTETRQALTVAKAQTYAVVSPPKGIAAGKAQVYAVVTPPQGISVAKAQVYAVVEIPDIQVSKAQVYSVLEPDGDVAVSKALVYSVVEGLFQKVSKAVAYTILAPAEGANVSKAVAYSVIRPAQWSEPGEVVVDGITEARHLTEHRYDEAGAVVVDAISEARFESSGPIEERYDEAGAVVIDGITESRRNASTYIFREPGEVVVDGITEADRSFHYYDEEGAVVLDGITDTLSAVSNTSGVSQVAAEFLAQSSPAGSVSQVAAEFLIQGEGVGGVSQVGAEFLIRGNAPAYAPQIAAEFLVRNQHPKADFMPLLTRLLAARTEAQSQARLAAR